MEKKPNIYNSIGNKFNDLLVKQLLKIEGRIALFSEAKEAKKYLLDVKLKQQIKDLEEKENLKYEALKFQTLNDPEAFKNIIDAKVNEKYLQLRLAFRGKREKIKNAKDQNNPKLEEERKQLEVFEKYIQEELVKYRAQLETEVANQVSKNTANIDLEKAAKEKEQNIIEGRKLLENKNQRAYEKYAAMCDKKVKKLNQKRDKLHKKVTSTTGTSGYKLPEDVVLQVKDLCMYFGGVKAVDGLSFEVKKGEIYGLIGPNGAGKTTVFNCITQFYKPTKGDIYFENKLGKVVRLNEKVVHDVILEGIVRTFQNIEVIKEISVVDNLLIAAHRQFHTNLFEHMIHSPKLKAEEIIIKKRALEVLDFMGLSSYANWYAWGLPYGILKKIEIARTLMCNPQLIILDEPAAGLNDSETADLAKLIHKIKDAYGCTILLVEHDMGLVMDICDHICAISFGKKLAIGTAEEIQANKEVQAAYLGVSEGE